MADRVVVSYSDLLYSAARDCRARAAGLLAEAARLEDEAVLHSGRAFVRSMAGRPVYVSIPSPEEAGG